MAKLIVFKEINYDNGWNRRDKGNLIWKDCIWSVIWVVWDGDSEGIGDLQASVGEDFS